MKRKIIILISIIVLIIITVAFCWRIYFINKFYPSPTIISHSIGETIDDGKVSISVQNSQLLSGDNIREAFPNFSSQIKNRDGSDVADDQIYALCATIIIENLTTEVQRISLAQICLESLVWSNGVSGSLYSLFNEEKELRDPTNIVLQANDKMTVVVPYMMYDFQFNSIDWNKINTRTFSLVLTNYPFKHVIPLENN